MSTITTIAVLLFAHFIGDFVMQTDVWAKTKSSNNIALTKHILAYTGTLFLFALALFDPLTALWFSVLNGIAHWNTDYVTSRITKKLWQQQRVHDFFVVIGADQLIHYLTLLFFLRYV